MKNVSDGYARNFLLPGKLAEIYTPQAMKRIEFLKKQEESAKLKGLEVLKNSFKKLSEFNLVIQKKASEKGQLFASIDTERIAGELEKQGIGGIKPDFIQLEKPIKKLGRYDVIIKIGDLEGKLSLEITNP